VRVRVSRGTSPCRFASRARAADRRHILPPVGLVPRGIAIPEDWKGRRVLLHFRRRRLSRHGVDQRPAGGTPRGRQHAVSVRHHALAEAWLGTPSPCAPKTANRPLIPRGKQYWEPKSASIFYTRTSGIWPDRVARSRGRQLSHARQHHPIARWRRAFRCVDRAPGAGHRVCSQGEL